MSALMLDLDGHTLSQEEQEILQHPMVGGVILFSRNYHEPSQLQALTRSIRQAASRPVLIAIDHEGGRVQRCRDGFATIPAMAAIERCAESTAESERWARELGWLMATEVLGNGIDFSFAPVLDINGCSEVIGDRAFSDDPDVVIRLAGAFIKGMNRAGMQATGKHFPGHGSVQADSHIAVPVDGRSLNEIRAVDMRPFKELISTLQGLMPAHVIYSDVDPLPAGFSPFWLRQVLRKELEFDGVIFSDDLAMQGATVIGDMQSRAEQALEAGCDMILVCNDRAGAIKVLDKVAIPPQRRPFIASMQGHNSLSWSDRESHDDWKAAMAVADTIRNRADR